jgi:hypothetical protein
LSFWREMDTEDLIRLLREHNGRKTLSNFEVRNRIIFSKFVNFIKRSEKVS